jgi:hypothetical protein
MSKDAIRRLADFLEHTEGHDKMERAERVANYVRMSQVEEERLQFFRTSLGPHEVMVLWDGEMQCCFKIGEGEDVTVTSSRAREAAG